MIVRCTYVWKYFGRLIINCILCYLGTRNLLWGVDLALYSIKHAWHLENFSIFLFLLLHYLQRVNHRFGGQTFCKYPTPSTIDVRSLLPVHQGEILNLIFTVGAVVDFYSQMELWKHKFIWREGQRISGNQAIAGSSADTRVNKSQIEEYFETLEGEATNCLHYLPPKNRFLGGSDQ
jgi:hypothetical protein